LRADFPKAMIDFGFDKIALIGAVALIVIGPERLPRVARTVGHLLGKAQRYVSDVKAEVGRSIELEELKKMKSQVETAARDVEQSVSAEIHQTRADFNSHWDSANHADAAAMDRYQTPSYFHKPKKKNWRLKRSAVPQWYKQRHGVRGKVQSGAARVARFRPPRAQT
jgi:sec-independent protein translocase protein TatB